MRSSDTGDLCTVTMQQVDGHIMKVKLQQPLNWLVAIVVQLAMQLQLHGLSLNAIDEDLDEHNKTESAKLACGDCCKASFDVIDGTDMMKVKLQPGLWQLLHCSWLVAIAII